MSSLTVHLKDAADAGLSTVGGKALNIGRLMGASLDVPPGFCLTTDAFREAVGPSGEIPDALPDEVREALRAAYEDMGEGPVAVRSSATAEDLPEASFAGQQDTVLNVDGAEALERAVLDCWASLFSERARAYRADLGMDDSQAAMAVVVQRMVDARCAGVLFTVDPTTGDRERMVIEAVPGIGESLVSGAEDPDRWVISRNDSSILDAPSDEDEPVLAADEVLELCRLGAAIEQVFRSPQDIEWARDAEGFKVLQSRAVTALDAADDTESVARAERQRLINAAAGEPTIWSSYQAAEVIAAPLPMSYGVVSRWLAHDGGHGAAHRALGYMPEPTNASILELICGRTYYCLNEEARSYIAGMPYRHNYAAIRKDPPSAAMAIPEFQPQQVGCSFVAMVPFYMWRLWGAARRHRALRETYAKELEDEILPAFEDYVKEQRKVDLEELSSEDLVRRVLEWMDHATRVVGQHAIQPSITAGEAMLGVQQLLTQALGDEQRARELTQELVAAGVENKTTEAATRLWQVGQGEVSLEEFLEEFGHRAPGELELATPRWSEDVDAVRALADGLKGMPSPADRIERQREARERLQSELLEGEDAEKLAPVRAKLKQELEAARRYFPFRENPKHYLLMDFELVRRGLLEIAKRYELGDGIFYLTPEELPNLLKAADMTETIRRRRRRRRIELRIELPDVIFSDDLAAIGRPQERPEAGEALTGLGVSTGTVTGRARVILDPADGGRLSEGEILVARSTDPGWTPIVLRAAGLVLERGGMLSHGAVVAREYGLPAVTNVADATELIRTGEQLRIDGRTGRVDRLGSDRSPLS